MTNTRNFPGSSGRLPPNRDIFDQALEEILDKDSAIAYSIVTAVKRMINRFHLTGVEPHELLIRAYLRGKDALKAGKQIHNAHAWLRSTVYNIVREDSKRRRKTCAHDPSWIENTCGDTREDPQTLAIEEEIAAQYVALYQSLQRLKLEEPQVFFLIEERHVGSKSWQEIELSYATASGEVGVSQAALRQRYSRGLKRLRKFFHEVYPF